MGDYLERINALPDVQRVVVRTTGGEQTVTVAIGKPAHQHQLLVRLITSNLSSAVAAQILAEARKKRGLLLCAPLVSDELGRRLGAANVNYVDLRGNARLRLEPGYLTWIAGQRGEQLSRPTPTDIRYPGYRVMFAYITKPDLITAPLRTVATASGTSVSAVSAMQQRMKLDGIARPAKKGRSWMPGQRRRLLEHWLAAYPTQIRPRLLVGTFQLKAATPEEMERHVHAALDGTYDWQLAGTSAAWKMTHHYRAGNVCIQTAGNEAEIRRQLRAIPDQNGPFSMLRSIGPLAVNENDPTLAHPLLVYSELMTSGDDRAIETAEMIFDKAWQE